MPTKIGPDITEAPKYRIGKFLDQIFLVHDITRAVEVGSDGTNFFQKYFKEVSLLQPTWPKAWVISAQENQDFQWYSGNCISVRS